MLDHRHHFRDGILVGDDDGRVEEPPHHTTGIVKDDGEHHGVDQRDGVLASLRGQGQQDAGGQKKEQEGGENGNSDAFHGYYNIRWEIFA